MNHKNCFLPETITKFLLWFDNFVWHYDNIILSTIYGQESVTELRNVKNALKGAIVLTQTKTPCHVMKETSPSSNPSPALNALEVNIHGLFSNSTRAPNYIANNNL